MYSATRYWSDVKESWKPVEHAGRTFGKSLLKSRDPFIYVWPCLRMVAWFVAFLFVATLLTARRLINR